MENFMTTEEAAKYLKRTISYICYLCSNNKLQGARKIGKRMWIIPTQSVHDFKPGPQGFAAVKARKEAEAAALKSLIETAIHSAPKEEK